MAKYVVCPECEGEGYVGTLGDYTPDEFNEAFADESDGPWDYYSRLHEASKQACDFCKGNRVVTQAELAEYQDYLEYEAERNAERRMGC
jgi:hypothetical protein